MHKIDYYKYNREVFYMDIPVMKLQEMNEEKDIFRLLDRGIDDMEEKRELPVDEAFEMITKLRTARRNERA